MLYDETKKLNQSEEDLEILQLLEMLSQVPEAPVPAEFDLRLRRALKEETARMKRKKTNTWKKWSAAAACLMIGLLSVQMINGGVGGGMFEGLSSETEGGMAPDHAMMQFSGSEAESEADVMKSADGDGVQSNGSEVEPMELTGQSAETSTEPVEPGVGSDNGQAAIAASGEYGAASEGLPQVPDYDYLNSAFVDGQNGEAGENIGEAGSAEAGGSDVSRGQWEARRDFEESCKAAMNMMTESIVLGDSQLLAEAMMYQNSQTYSRDQAEKALKLYDDLLDEEEAELSWQRVNLTAWSKSNIYRLTDGRRDLLVVISQEEDGLKISEPVLDQSQWLYEQIGRRSFTLVDVICDPESGQIEFQVELKKKLRSFVWKETESL